MMCFQERGVKKIRKSTHEGISKAAKMNPIMHFFGEYVRRVDFTGNVLDRNGLILYPFSDRVLA
jgi:hypothetical protein